MIRWLKIARAEIVRDIKTTLRYPVELCTGLIVLWVLFMGLYMGAKLLAGGKALNGDLDGMVIGFSMWFFAIVAINTMSTDVESEARQGTLEQVYMHTPNFIGLLWLRGITHMTLGAGMVATLSLMIQATTGHYLHLRWYNLLPVLMVMAVTLLGIAGVGLILGALSLAFKRIGQLSSIVQFGMFFLAYLDLNTVSEPWRSVLSHFPLARGVDLLGRLLAPEPAPGLAGFGLTTGVFQRYLAPAPGPWLGGFGWLVLDSAVYALIGTLVFIAMERIAKRAGMLSHY